MVNIDDIKIKFYPPKEEEKKPQKPKRKKTQKLPEEEPLCEEPLLASKRKKPHLEQWREKIRQLTGEEEPNLEKLREKILTWNREDEPQTMLTEEMPLMRMPKPIKKSIFEKFSASRVHEYIADAKFSAEMAEVEWSRLEEEMNALIDEIYNSDDD